MRVHHLLVWTLCLVWVGLQVADAKGKKSVEASAEVAPAVKESASTLDDDNGLKLGLSLDLFTEFSHLNGRRVIDVAAFDESADYSSGPLAVRAWVWLPWTERFRFGGGVAYRSYAIDDGGAFSLGSLIDTYGHVDFELPRYKKFSFALAGRLGISMLIPGGDFSRDIDRLQSGGVDVFGGPRFGWMIGGSVTTRYPLTRTFGLVVDLGFDIGRLYLYRTKQTIENIDFDKTWTSEIQRMTLSAGVEMAL